MAPTAAEVSAHLAEGRAEMEAMMAATCRITKAGPGEPVFNEETLQYTDPPRVTVYEGPCRIQIKADINSNVVETTAGDHEWTYLTDTLQVPIVADPEVSTGTTAAVRPDNVAEILTNPDDTSLVGRVFNIQGMYHKTHATHRRFRVREVVG